MKKSIKSGNRVNGPKSPQCGKDRNVLPLRFYVKSISMSSLTHLEALNLDFYEFLHFMKAEMYQNNKIQHPNNCKIGSFSIYRSSKIDFT